jgi:hypothetical protein
MRAGGRGAVAGPPEPDTLALSRRSRLLKARVSASPIGLGCRPGSRAAAGGRIHPFASSGGVTARLARAPRRHTPATACAFRINRTHAGTTGATCTTGPIVAERARFPEGGGLT